MARIVFARSVDTTLVNETLSKLRHPPTPIPAAESCCTVEGGVTWSSLCCSRSRLLGRLSPAFLCTLKLVHVFLLRDTHPQRSDAYAKPIENINASNFG